MSELAMGDVWGVVLVFTVAVAMMALCALTTSKWK
ncbi:hypothetical protein SAMN05444747_11683 [Variovorax sp. OV329]|nr:hypothetical protein SAMN05444747_11683 [Variovorax sp. OV329]